MSRVDVETVLKQMQYRDKFPLQSIVMLEELIEDKLTDEQKAKLTSLLQDSYDKHYEKLVDMMQGACPSIEEFSFLLSQADVKDAMRISETEVVPVSMEMGKIIFEEITAEITDLLS